jgi:hypothetical protein
VQDLQHYLGHSSLRTTLGYLHWIPNYRPPDLRDYALTSVFVKAPLGTINFR